VQYAIVADDNNHFLDPYWKAMYEVPTFVQVSPFGPPIAMGGSASAKKVNVGGKLGIVKDPFGTQGQPQYLGATLPLDGYGVINLSVSEDGKVLIGQLYGYFSANILDMQKKDNKNLAWSVDALINAALAMPEQDRMREHLVVDASAAQNIPVPTQGNGTNGANGVVAAPAGTAFDPAEVKVEITDGRLGDVIEVDLKRRAAYALLGISTIPPASQSQLDPQEVKQLMQHMGSFWLELGEQKSLTGAWEANGGAPTQYQYRDFTLATEADGSVLSRKADLTSAKFAKEGRLYLIPNLSQGDLERLRAGQTVGEKWATDIMVNFHLDETAVAILLQHDPVLAGRLAADGGYAHIRLDVAAKDFALTANTFFGDRPLDNPGYSAMTLKGEVKQGSTDRLDVYKVEQRLKYLGYTGYEKTHDQKVKEFTVDGKWASTEETALRGFYAATHYTSYGNGKGYEGSDTAVGKSVVPTTDTTINENFNWLNAYNAPHLVNAYEALRVPFPTTNTPVNRFANGAGIKEPFTTSWVYDLMQRWRSVQNSLATMSDADKAKVLASDHIKVNGMTLPPGYDKTAPHQHETGGHSTAMALDLGIVGNFIDRNHSRGPSNNNQAIPNMTGANGWNYQNALDWSGLISTTTNPGEQVALRNFLSLYSLTVSDDDKTNQNGTWEEWSLVNGDAAKQALFGDGTQAKSMIQHVYVGDGPTSSKDKNDKTISVPANYNAYPLILGVLQKLSIDAGNANDHEHHFHIDFRTPDRVAITKQPKLLTTNTESGISMTVSTDFVEQARQEFEQETGEIAMVTFDTTALPHAQVTMVAQAPQASKGSKERVLGVCVPIEYLATGRTQQYLEGGLSPETTAVSYFEQYENRTITESEYPKTIKDTQVTRQPTHGTVSVTYQIISGESRVFWRYTPEVGFTGKDRVDFSVQVKGQSVRLVYYMEVTKKHIDSTPGDAFCKGVSRWKISQTDVDSPAPSANTLTVWQRSSELSALLADASQHLSFADLPGSSVGQTTGTGPSASITLDKDAAGHGWYIDPTPLDNTDDYLPTSNPNIWQAKPGSESQGKMDMLSVLLHEYGHALGLEHSGDASDFMASMLQPGQRRLPSSQELALMSELLAQIKADMQTADAGGTITPTSDGAATPSGALSSIPADPQLPPGTPVPSGVGLAALLAARQRREGLASALQASKQQTTPQAPSPQMQLAAKPTLTNPQFSGSQGWESTGDVRMAQGMATLHETASSQTRLNQAFVVGANDRVLSFTLTGLGLDDASNAPDDAFEVALIFDGVGFSTI